MEKRGVKRSFIYMAGLAAVAPGARARCCENDTASLRIIAMNPRRNGSCFVASVGPQGLFEILMRHPCYRAMAIS